MSERVGPHRWFFDLWSFVYDAPLVQRFTYRPEQNAVLRDLERDPPRSLLDLGCGTGRLATRIAGALPGCRVVGCDFSHGMLRHAHERWAAGSWVQGDALALPFPDASFEAVTSTEAFHWFPDQVAALRELFRILTPGGRLLVSLVNPHWESVSQVSELVSGFLGEPMTWPTRQSMRRHLEEAGFRVTDQSLVVRMPFPLSFPTVLTRGERPR